MELKQHLTPKLKALRLSGILDTLEARTQQATTERWSDADFLERLLEDEVERRAQKQLALRVRRADLPGDKTLETFDFSFNPGLNRQLLYELAAGNYIREKRNVLLCGPTGLWLTCHQFRHTLGRHLVEARVPVTSIQKLFGHMRLRTTEVYLYITNSQVQADYESAMEQVAERLQLKGGAQ